MYTKPYNDGLMHGVEHVAENRWEAVDYLTEFPVAYLTQADGTFVRDPSRTNLLYELARAEDVKIVSISGVIFVRCF